LAVVQTGQALARLVSSVAFGFMLQFATFGTAVYAAIGSLVVAVVVAWRLNARRGDHDGHLPGRPEPEGSRRP
jgi:hypothetical protein